MAKRNWMPSAIDEATDRRLWNWADWVRSSWRTKKGNHSRCPGLEGQYRAPIDQTQDEFNAVRNPWRDEIDEHDAMFVDKVIAANWFPHREAAFLRAHYIIRRHERQTAKNLGILRYHYQQWHARSVAIMKNRLTIAELRVHHPRHNLDAAMSVNEASENSQASSREEQTNQALAA